MGFLGFSGQSYFLTARHFVAKFDRSFSKAWDAGISEKSRHNLLQKTARVPMDFAGYISYIPIFLEI